MYIEIDIVYIGSGNVCNFRYPLGVLEHMLHKYEEIAVGVLAWISLELSWWSLLTFLEL